MLCSVVIPVYNNAAYLPACLDSIRTQTCGDWECILVDDGSSDNSVEVCAGYCEKDPRFRLLRTRHAGAGAARDAGFAESRGEFVFYSDADDVWHPALLASCLSALSDPGLDFVYFDCRPFMGELEESVRTADVAGAACERVDDAFDASLDRGWGRAMWHYFFRRRAVDGVLTGSRFTRCGDRHFNFLFLKKAPKGVHLHAELYFYRRYAQSQVGRPLTLKDITGYSNYVHSAAGIYGDDPAALRRLRREEFAPLVKDLLRKAIESGAADGPALVAHLVRTLRRDGILGLRDFSAGWAWRIWRLLLGTKALPEAKEGN